MRTIVRQVRRAHPFEIHGWVVLPEHLHCLLQLPAGDADFRWLTWPGLTCGAMRCAYCALRADLYEGDINAAQEVLPRARGGDRPLP
jgi:hypothetical protein